MSVRAKQTERHQARQGAEKGKERQGESAREDVYVLQLSVLA